MCICAYAYHPTSLSHRVGRIHHIDRVYFEIHAPGMGLESTLLFIRHPKTCIIISVNFQPYSKIDCFVLIDTMREGGETPLAHIAQSVERSPLKRMAAGSIPVVGICRCPFFLAERSLMRGDISQILIPFSILFYFFFFLLKFQFFVFFFIFSFLYRAKQRGKFLLIKIFANIISLVIVISITS